MPTHPIKSIRRAGVPLVAFETADPAATIAATLKALNGKAGETPSLQWDIIRGLAGLNQAGLDALSSAGINPMQTLNPAECLSQLGKLPEYSLIFVCNAHAVLGDATVRQAVWNLRDEFKTNGRTLVLLAPKITLPPELSGDVVVISEALPDAAALQGIVSSICGDAGLTVADDDKRTFADVLLGLSAFAAEQVLALSISKDGVDRVGLWERKRKLVEQTPGLSVWRGGESFADLGGLSNLKAFLTRILGSGNTPVRALGYIDEVEKLFAGTAGDLSGVSQDMLRCFLATMQDCNIPGMILVGPPGTGKSAIAKAAGSVAGAEVIAIDTGAMTGSLVGESQAKIRAAMDVFKAVSSGQGMFLATCNKIASLPPELRRRFSLGTFYVDLPSSEEQAAIWPIWRKRYSIPDTEKLPECDGWTGAEIRACCDVAYRAGMTLREASSFVVPVCKSAADQIDALRTQASGRFISANSPGVYTYRKTMGPATTATRKIGE